MRKFEEKKLKESKDKIKNYTSLSNAVKARGFNCVLSIILSAIGVSVVISIPALTSACIPEPKRGPTANLPPITREFDDILKGLLFKGVYLKGLLFFRGFLRVFFRVFLRGVLK